MHVHSFHHIHDLHVFERSRTAIEHHAAATLILAMMIVLAGGYALNLQSSRVELFQFSDASEVGLRLSRFADPQYAHEIAAREQMLRAALAGLQRDFQADRVYIAVYGVTEEFSVEYRVISVLETTKTGIAPTIERLQGIGRSSWLQMEDNAYRVNWFSTGNAARIYGMELHDEQGTPIGYLGIENMQAHGFAERDFQLLRDNAEAVITALVKPLEQLKDSI